LQEADAVAFIQCVGSREPQRPYCSKICCTASVQQAIEYKAKNPDLDVYILYRDLRTYGQREELYRKAREAGVLFIRFALEDKPRVEKAVVDGKEKIKISVKDLRRNTDKLVRGLVLCSPCNPTGAVYTLSEIKAIAEWAREHEVWIIADEIYRRIHYGQADAPSFMDLPDELLERVVIITGASKAYAMTGWRIGAALAPPHLVQAMAALQSHTTTGANHPAQWAAVTAYRDPRVEQDVVRMVAAFRRRRDRIVSRFRSEAPGIEFVDPHGAFYFFFRVDGTASGMGGQTFCTRLMQEEGVALVPGGVFGDDRWVRLSYAVSEVELDAALDRLLRFIARLSASQAA
jgi:aspartate aminotransferase